MHPNKATGAGDRSPAPDVLNALCWGLYRAQHWQSLATELRWRELVAARHHSAGTQQIVAVVPGIESTIAAPTSGLHEQTQLAGTAPSLSQPSGAFLAR